MRDLAYPPPLIDKWEIAKKVTRRQILWSLITLVYYCVLESNAVLIFYKWWTKALFLPMQLLVSNFR